ncbi:MAG: hypothetical protein ACEY3M_23400, partial [Wolbachia sp.]
VDESRWLLIKLARVTAKLVELIDKNVNIEKDLNSMIRVVKQLVGNMKHQRQEGTEQQTKSDINVKTVKKSNNGDPLLEVVGREKADSLKETINKNVKNVMVARKSYDFVFPISNIDADINEEKVEREIKKWNNDIGEGIVIPSGSKFRSRW